MTGQDWRGEYLAMVVDCEQRRDLLDDWESGFVDSLRAKFDRALFVPSPNQVAKLEAVWERVTDERPVVTGAHGGQVDLF
jgi:hypothetical protein